MKSALLLTAVLALVSCASTPLKLEGVNRDINPAMVTAEHPYTRARVVWGGMIIKTQPLQDITQIEVLAFPLEQNGEPDRSAASMGRFLIVHRVFLEPADLPRDAGYRRSAKLARPRSAVSAGPVTVFPCSTPNSSTCGRRMPAPGSRPGFTSGSASSFKFFSTETFAGIQT